MSVKDISSAYRRLLGRQESISASLGSALDVLSGSQPSLAAAVRRLLDGDGSVHSPFRLLAFPVLGAISGDEEMALPVAMLSRVWWTGAEVFDDLADGEFDAAGTGLSGAQASIASASCLTLLPQALIAQQGLSARLTSEWTREFADASLSAAEGQLNDVSAGTGTISWSAVMRIYAGKSGVPYGRDAAMVAMLAHADDAAVRGWRAFGRLFGVLRQLANDRASATDIHDEDLANGTWTLQLALALEESDPRDRQELASLHARAADDLSTRSMLRERLDAAGMAVAYGRRVEAMRRKLTGLLMALAGPSQHRDLMHWMIDVSAAQACPRERAGAA
ncbi:polyprenyl synthetase family protein [Streptomyces sp. ME03-5709C]|nr:polyprenyl synthetase family protein [Streptomyces sp. ME03-5709C]